MSPRNTGLLVAAAVFAVDQLSKWVITQALRLQDIYQLTLLPMLNLTWVENRGVSLGLLHADSQLERWLLVAVTAAIAAGVLVWLWRERERGEAAVLGLILGGALGNILDRSRYGYVVDFIDFHLGGFRPFLVFNAADAAITLGVVGLVARSLIATRRKDRQNA